MRSRDDAFSSGRNAYVPLFGEAGSGLYLLVDLSSVALFVVGKKWYLGAGGYAVDSNGNYAHKLISDPKWETVDHINGNRLDCRVVNLRGASRAENNRNTRKRRHSKQLYKGVRQHSPTRWTARVRCNGKENYLGSFDSPEDAARAYDKKCLELFGDFSLLNFNEGEKNVNEPTVSI